MNHDTPARGCRAKVLLIMVLLHCAAFADTGEANIKTLGIGDVLPLTRIPADIYLRIPNDPDDALWERVPQYQVDLMPAPPVHPSIALRQADNTRSIPVYVSVVSDGLRLYVRMRWRDQSKNALTSFDTFSDAAAVQFALGTAEKTSFMMGTPDQPVNIWYWRADNDQSQDLAAGGFGSLTPLPVQTVTAASTFRGTRHGGDNQWTVVFSRPLHRHGEHDVPLRPDTVQPVGFAIWQGASAQRDGSKVVTMGWLKLDLGALNPAAP